MNLEGFSKRGMELGGDPEKIRENQGISSQDSSLLGELSSAVKYLAVLRKAQITSAIQSKRIDDFFESELNKKFNDLVSKGLNITKEMLMYYVEREVKKQIEDDRKYGTINFEGAEREIETAEQETAALSKEINEIFEDGKGKRSR